MLRFGNHQRVSVLEAFISAVVIAWLAVVIVSALAALSPYSETIAWAVGITYLMTGGTVIIVNAMNWRNPEPGGPVYNVKLDRQNFPQLDANDNPIQRNYNVELSVVQKRRIRRNIVTPAIPDWITVEKMQWFAAEVIVNETPITHDNFANGALGRRTYDALRAWMFEQGMLRIKGVGRQAGTALTEKGDIWLRQVHLRLGSPPPNWKRPQN